MNDLLLAAANSDLSERLTDAFARAYGPVLKYVLGIAALVFGIVPFLLWVKRLMR